MKRLIKKSQEYSFFIDKHNRSNEDFITIYKNPTQDEIEKARKIDGDIRGLLYRNGDIYIWPSVFWHNGVKNLMPSDVPQLDMNEFHFFTEGKDYIRIHNDGAIMKDEEVRPVVCEAYEILLQILNPDAELEITYYDINNKEDYIVALQDYVNNKDLKQKIAKR